MLENKVMMKKLQYIKNQLGKGTSDLRDSSSFHLLNFQMNINQRFKNATHCTVGRPV